MIFFLEAHFVLITVHAECYFVRVAHQKGARLERWESCWIFLLISLIPFTPVFSRSAVKSRYFRFRYQAIRTDNLFLFIIKTKNAQCCFCTNKDAAFHAICNSSAVFKNVYHLLNMSCKLLAGRWKKSIKLLPILKLFIPRPVQFHEENHTKQWSMESKLLISS